MAKENWNESFNSQSIRKNSEYALYFCLLEHNWQNTNKFEYILWKSIIMIKSVNWRIDYIRAFPLVGVFYSQFLKLVESSISHMIFLQHRMQLLYGSSYVFSVLDELGFWDVKLFFIIVLQYLGFVFSKKM